MSEYPLHFCKPVPGHNRRADTDHREDQRKNLQSLSLGRGQRGSDDVCRIARTQTSLDAAIIYCFQKNHRERRHRETGLLFTSRARLS